MRSQTTPRGRSPSLAKIVILALVGVLLLSQFGLWGGSEEDRDPIQHGAHFAVRNLQNGAAHERDGSVDEKQRDPPSPPYGEQETDPNFEVVDVFAENIPPKKQEVDEWEKVDARSLSELLKHKDTKLSQVVCNALDSCYQMNRPLPPVDPCINYEYVEASTTGWTLTPPPMEAHLTTDYLYRAAESLKTLARTYTADSDNPVALAHFLESIAKKVSCQDHFWTKVFQTIGFMDSSGVSVQSADALLNVVDSVFVSDAPGNWDRPFRHHFIVILSSSPVINVSCLSTFGVVAPNQRIIQLNYRPSLVMAIHGEINTIKYGIKLEKSVFVREATLLPALSPHLSVLQPPPMVNIVVANHESGALILQYVEMLKLYEECSHDNHFRLVVADSSGDAPFQQLHSALTQSGLKFRLLRHAPPFRKTLMLNSAVRATESPPTVRLQTGEALELLVGANDVEDTNPSIVFVTDLSVFLPAQHLWRTRCLTMEGKRTYFPEVFRLKFGAVATLSQDTGFTEADGYGVYGMYRSDFTSSQGYDTQAFQSQWGGEDTEFAFRLAWGYSAAFNKSESEGLAMLRTRGERVIHLWHPPFDNIAWYGGVKHEVPSHMKCAFQGGSSTSGKGYFEVSSAMWGDLAPQCQVEIPRPTVRVVKCNDTALVGEKKYEENFAKDHLNTLKKIHFKQKGDTTRKANARDFSMKSVLQWELRTMLHNVLDIYRKRKIVSILFLDSASDLIDMDTLSYMAKDLGKEAHAVGLSFLRKSKPPLPTGGPKPTKDIPICTTKLSVRSMWRKLAEAGVCFDAMVALDDQVFPRNKSVPPEFLQAAQTILLSNRTAPLMHDLDEDSEIRLSRVPTGDWGVIFKIERMDGRCREQSRRHLDCDLFNEVMQCRFVDFHPFLCSRERSAFTHELPTPLRLDRDIRMGVKNACIQKRNIRSNLCFCQRSLVYPMSPNSIRPADPPLPDRHIFFVDIPELAHTLILRGITDEEMAVIEATDISALGLKTSVNGKLFLPRMFCRQHEHAMKDLPYPYLSVQGLMLRGDTMISFSDYRNRTSNSLYSLMYSKLPRITAKQLLRYTISMLGVFIQAEEIQLQLLRIHPNDFVLTGLGREVAFLGSRVGLLSHNRETQQCPTSLLNVTKERIDEFFLVPPEMKECCTTKRSCDARHINSFMAGQMMFYLATNAVPPLQQEREGERMRTNSVFQENPWLEQMYFNVMDDLMEELPSQRLAVSVAQSRIKVLCKEAGC